jgi:hypothetical protein
MKSKGVIYLVAILFLIYFAPEGTYAQVLPAAKNDPCATPQNITQWVNCRVDVIAAARINQQGTSKQVELPSIADRSASLVDKTDAPDLFGLALNLAGINKGTSTSDNSNPTISTSFYGLYAALQHHDPLDPAFYLKHAGLRRASFTIGQGASESGSSNDAHPTLVGVKYLIINKRDASSSTNRTLLQDVSNRLRDATVNFAATEDEVETYIYDQLKTTLGYPRAGESEDDAVLRFGSERFDTTAKVDATLKQLTPDQQKAIDDIIVKRIGTAVELRAASQESFEKIRAKSQLSFTFQTKQRPDFGIDEYRTGLLYDVGVYQRLNLAVNATFDYDDSKVIGADKRGGRIAAEGYFHLTETKNIFTGKDPILLSSASEAKWLTGTKPIYTGQVKLTIPIFDGVSLPFSFSVANRKELINESKVKGRFGFTLDFAKLLKGLR